jgi:REP element-mobilizing transposase RayT
MPTARRGPCLRNYGRMWLPRTFQPQSLALLAMNGHRKTCRRFNERGHPHSLTFSRFSRRPFLSKDRSRMWLVEAIDRAREKHAFDLWAYVVMPEHVHLLIWPRNPVYSISRMLTSIKRRRFGCGRVHGNSNSLAADCFAWICLPCLALLVAEDMPMQSHGHGTRR